MRRTRLGTLVVVSFLGLVTNVAVVAWSMWSARTEYIGGADLYLGDSEERLSVTCTIHRGPGKTVVFWMPSGTVLLPPDYKPPTTDMPPPSWSTVLEPARVAQVQALPIITGDRGTQHVPSHFDIACGWPMRSFRGGVTQCPARDPSATHEFGAWPGLRYTVPGKGSRMEYRTLPLDPITLGLLVNTAMYAACWWILLFGRGTVRTARRRLRNKRGACLACGYDRRGLSLEAPCPECGLNPAAVTCPQPPASAGGSDHARSIRSASANASSSACS